jgi:hypothetical protein
MKDIFSDRIANSVNGDLQDAIWQPPLFEIAVGHFVEQVVCTHPVVIPLAQTLGIRHEVIRTEVQGTEFATANHAHQSHPKN